VSIKPLLGPLLIFVDAFYTRVYTKIQTGHPEYLIISIATIMAQPQTQMGPGKSAKTLLIE